MTHCRTVAWDLVVFDNDGVLVDSERLANGVLAGLLSELWRPTTLQECIDAYLGGSIEWVRAIVEAESGSPLPADFEDRYHHELFAAFERGLSPVAGVEAVIDRLEESGTSFCVASSGSHQRVERALRHAGLWDRFAGRVFSADDVARGKPAPDLFLHAASRMGAVPEATVVIEDSPLGVEAARSAGMAVIGFAAVTPARERLGAASVVVETMQDVGAELAAMWIGRSRG